MEGKALMNKELELLFQQAVAKRVAHYEESYFQADQGLRNRHRVGDYTSLAQMDRENQPTQETGAIRPIASGLFRRA